MKGLYFGIPGEISLGLTIELPAAPVLLIDAGLWKFAARPSGLASGLALAVALADVRSVLRLGPC
jgi:hypothetical protein